MGVLTSGGRARRAELAFTTTSVIVGAIPDFLVGVVLVCDLRRCTSTGCRWRAGPGSARSCCRWSSLAIGPAAILSRIVRVEMITVLQADYVRTARAKRLPALAVYVGTRCRTRSPRPSRWAACCSARWSPGTVLVENVFAWPGLGSTIVSSILTKDYPLVQGDRARLRHRRAGREPRSSTSRSRCSTRARRSGRAERMTRRWWRGRCARRSAPARRRACWLLLVFVAGGPRADAVVDAGRRRSTPTAMLQGPSGRALGRHRRPRPRHLLPRPGGDPALDRARAARHRDRRGRRRSCSARAGVLPAAGPPGCVTAVVNIAVAFPGLLLALFFAVDLRRRHAGRGARDRLRDAPAFARLAQTLSPRSPGATTWPRPGSPASAGSGCCSGTCCPTSPSRWSSTRRSAPAARCSPSPGCPSSGSACRHPTTTGAGCSAKGWTASTSTRWPRSRPGVAVVLAGLAFNLVGEAVAEGVGLTGRGPRPARAGPRRSRPTDRRVPTATTRCSSSRDLRVTFPGPAARSGRCAASLQRRPRRGGRRRRRVRLGQEPDRAGRGPADRGPRPGHASAASSPARRDAAPRRRPALSAPRWPWCSRTR